MEYILFAVDVTGKLRMLFAVSAALYGVCRRDRESIVAQLIEGISEDSPNDGVWVWIGELESEINADDIGTGFDGYSLGNGKWFKPMEKEILNYLKYANPWYDLQCYCVAMEAAKLVDYIRPGRTYALPNKPLISCSKCHGLGYIMPERKE